MTLCAILTTSGNVLVRNGDSPDWSIIGVRLVSPAESTALCGGDDVNVNETDIDALALAVANELREQRQRELQLWGAVASPERSADFHLAELSELSIELRKASPGPGARE